MKNKPIPDPEKFQQALAHVTQHAQKGEDFDEDLDYIANKKGNYVYCISAMRRYAAANCSVAWFKHQDLDAFKHWAFITAKLRRLIIQHTPINWFPAYEFFYAILSDHQDILGWYKQYDLSYCASASSIQDRDNPKRPDFHGYQCLLALNGEWDELRKRCELILSMDLKKDKKYLIDHQFYLALANGDQQGMETVLTELTSPKIARVRNFEHAFTFTEHFISTHAVIYAKLAWMSGYPVQIDSPYIPKQWLPIAPLSDYPEPWDFMKEFDLYTPFAAPWNSFSPQPIAV